MRCWVVSSSVQGAGTANQWTDAIRENQCAYMGWGPEHEEKRKGYDYHHTVTRGSMILVARRSSWDWNCVLAGIVDSDVYEAAAGKNSVPDSAWAYHLSPVISSERLNELKIPMLLGKIEGTAKSQIPGAIFELTDEETKSKLQSEFERLKVEQQARGEIDMYTSLLEKNRNIVLNGAPGTGKTYLAKKIAQKVIFGETWVLKDESDFSDAERNQFSQQCKFVQFHPSYDYTDFVEGLRPTPPGANGNIGFKRIDGFFKSFCRDALNSCKYNEDGKFDVTNSSKFIFIIDEINRGEISKIFGELFFSVDPGYRGKKGLVQTQYTNLIENDDVFKKGFFVPENIYIIGTMNDIDRSVESLDFAMRRRFVFREITAADSATSMKLPESAKSRMTALNEAISRIDGLNSSYHIGAAYFLRDGSPTDDFVELWDLRLEPLLKEYLRGTPNAGDNLNNLKEAFELNPKK